MAVNDCSRLVGNKMIKRLYLRYVQTDLLDMILRQGGCLYLRWFVSQQDN